MGGWMDGLDGWGCGWTGWMGAGDERRRAIKNGEMAAERPVLTLISPFVISCMHHILQKNPRNDRPLQLAASPPLAAITTPPTRSNHQPPHPTQPPKSASPWST
jgi:hypothetical protein